MDEIKLNYEEPTQNDSSPDVRIENVFGTLKTVTTTPTWIPKNFREGFAIDTTNNLFYFYDFVDNVWVATGSTSLTANQLAAITGAASPSATNVFLTASSLKFGGTGADGALNVTSGTTTLDCSSANILIKNYTSINISAGATLAFSNPHANGTVIILKSQGAVTIAGTINAAGMGAAGGIGAVANTSIATAGNAGTLILDASVHSGGIGLDGVFNTSSALAGGAAGAALNNPPAYTVTSARLNTWRALFIAAGSGGTGGGASATDGGLSVSGASGGNGGRGGGAVLIECRGALNFSGTITTSGAAGNAGATATGGGTGAARAGSGGGGGGAAGMIIVLYNTLTANTGTLTAAGGAGGAGGDGGTGDGQNFPEGTGSGGGGAGNYTGAGGAGGASATQNNNGTVGSNGAAGAGGGGGGGGGTSSVNNVTKTGGAGGTSSSDSALSLVAQNNVFL